MVVRTQAAVSSRFARRSGQINQWVRARQSPIVVIASIALGILTALYGTAGRLVFLEFAVPQGWIVGAITYTALTQSHAGRPRRTRVTRWLLWSTLPVLALQQVAFVFHNQRWDLLETSGWLVLLIGLELAALSPLRVEKALQRLLHRDVLRAPADTIGEAQADLERAGDRWSVVGGWSVSVVLLLTWPLAADVASRWRTWTFGPAVTDQILIVVAGAIAGGWLGRMTGYGRLGTILTRRGLRLRVVPGHPDGAGGLRPIGDFYLYQSLVASLPAIFVAVWVLLISLGDRNPVLQHYRPYLTQYLWLLALAILFEVLVFLVPLRSIHLIMKKQKEEVLLTEADRLSPLIEAAQAQMEADSNEDWDAAKLQLAQLVERYKALEKTPTWPIDLSIRRRFTLRNLALLVPFAGYLVGQAPFWQQVSDVFKGLG